MVKTDDMEADDMSGVDREADRYVVRLSCGHEALEVVEPGERATAAGDSYACRECDRSQTIVESFRVDP
jgi:hypothetical protein